MYALTVKTAAAAEPITLAEAKLHLRIESGDADDNALVTALISAAREWVENYCRRSLVRRTLELRMDHFPCEIRLPRGPVASVTSVKYTDANGSSATMAASSYQVDTYQVPGRIVLVNGATWPVPQVGAINAVLVEYIAGYASDEASPTDHAANVPGAIKAAMKLIIGHLYENRELVSATEMYEVPNAVKFLLAPFEIRDFTLE